MKTKFLLVSALLLLAMAEVSQAGGRCGRWGGGGYWGGGRGWGGGPYWGGGWGGWGPSFGVSFVAPVPVYRTVYVVRRAPSYASYSAPILYRAQARLARLGYYPGPIDGDFGPMTSRALRSYQADYGLPITGRLDYQTRSSLGV
ncbi:MAG TPA: peptidoglycan-binding domain-containing protein [Terrimicrobiaceae bacterium]